MKEDEIIKQIIAIGISLYIKEIDYNKAVEIAKQTLKEHEQLVKKLTIPSVVVPKGTLCQGEYDPSKENVITVCGTCGHTSIKA